MCKNKTIFLFYWFVAQWYRKSPNQWHWLLEISLCYIILTTNVEYLSQIKYLYIFFFFHLFFSLFYFYYFFHFGVKYVCNPIYRINCQKCSIRNVVYTFDSKSNKSSILFFPPLILARQYELIECNVDLLQDSVVCMSNLKLCMCENYSHNNELFLVTRVNRKFTKFS